MGTARHMYQATSRINLFPLMSSIATTRKQCGVWIYILQKKHSACLRSIFTPNVSVNDFKIEITFRPSEYEYKA